MESTLRAFTAVALVSAFSLLQSGCCTIDLTCGSRACGTACGPAIARDRDPLFDGTLRHRVKGSIHSAANKVACAGGCGEVYWDESVNDPAVCDRCAQFGPGTLGCGSCSPWFVRLAKLWGTPYQASCSTGSCSSGCGSGSCVGHGALVNHLRGHLGCRSCGYTSESSHGTCPSCQAGSDHQSYEDYEQGTVIHQGLIHQGTIHQGVIHDGQVIHQGNAPAHSSPTPAKPRENQSGESNAPSNATSNAPSNAQNRMRLHQRSGQADPNGKLSAQLVNGHKRLVSTP